MSAVVFGGIFLICSFYRGKEQGVCYYNLPSIVTAKSLCVRCFDAEKLYSRVQASIFRLLVLIKR